MSNTSNINELAFHARRHAVMHLRPAEALSRCAIELAQAERSGLCDQRLRGRHFGLVCEDQGSADAFLFCRAVEDLGGRVAKISPVAAGLLASDAVGTTSVWLGRLYSLIECQGLPAVQVAEIRAAAEIPVFDGLAGEHRASAALSTMISAGTDEFDGRRYLLQAALIGFVP